MLQDAFLITQRTGSRFLCRPHFIMFSIDGGCGENARVKNDTNWIGLRPVGMASEELLSPGDAQEQMPE
jgi:hypothetical protein